MADYDSPWKEALDAYFQPFMEFCFADLASRRVWRVQFWVPVFIPIPNCQID